MKHSHRTKGFTLVELIVVLIILGILAALLLPTLTGYIEQARRTRAIAECRECVMAANSIGGQYYASERTEMPFVNDDANEKLILELAGQSGDITALEMEGAGTKKLVYTCADGRVVTYENGQFTLDGDADAGGDDGPEGEDTPSPSPSVDPNGAYRDSPATEDDIIYNMQLLLAKYKVILANNLPTGCTITRVVASNINDKKATDVTYYYTTAEGSSDYIKISLKLSDFGLEGVKVSNLQLGKDGNDLAFKVETLTGGKFYHINPNTGVVTDNSGNPLNNS